MTLAFKVQYGTKNYNLYLQQIETVFHSSLEENTIGTEFTGFTDL